MSRRYPNINDVNPEVMRKAKRLVEVYGQVPKPLILTGTRRILISGMFNVNGWVMLDKRVYRFVSREIQLYDDRFISNSVICTAISGSTLDKGKLIYQLKPKRAINFIQISVCDNNAKKEIVWNCPYCEEIYDNPYDNSRKLFSNIPSRKRYDHDNEVENDINKEILYPIYINDRSGDLKYIVKRSGSVISGESRLFPFLSNKNPYVYRWRGFQYLYVNVMYNYSAFSNST